MKGYAIEINTGAFDYSHTCVKQVFLDQCSAEARKCDLEREAAQMEHRILMCQNCAFNSYGYSVGEEADKALKDAKLLCKFASIAIEDENAYADCADETRLDDVPHYYIREVEVI